MFAVFANGVNPDNPLDHLAIGEVDPVPTPDEWVDVRVKAMSVNHHDLWALKGQALSADRTPMILGTDAAGIGPDGQEVIVHAVIGDPAAGGGDETLDPGRSLLSERYSGTFADIVRVPADHLIPKPADMSWQEAACLPTAYLTAYRMLATKANIQPGQSVLIQGAGGGVATALIMLAKAMGARVWVTTRDEAKAADALARGADEVFASGARLPDRVDFVMETVGAATWSHSLKSLRPGGAIVISGATSGDAPSADLNRVFFLQLRILGSTMGTALELHELVAFMTEHDVHPVIQGEWAMHQARDAFATMLDGQVSGKLVLVNDR
jgi:NADPH:quinone reductase-like Zn-dependent oxidoreductase